MKLNKKAVENAKTLIDSGSVVKDEKDEWSKDQPSTDDENEFIDKNSIDEYPKWYLGINEDEDEDNKGRYSFPFGDFEKVHRGGVIAAKVRAAQYDHKEIEEAADNLLKKIDEK